MNSIDKHGKRSAPGCSTPIRLVTEIRLLQVLSTHQVLLRPTQINALKPVTSNEDRRAFDTQIGT